MKYVVTTVYRYLYLLPYLYFFAPYFFSALTLVSEINKYVLVILIYQFVLVRVGLVEIS